MKTFDIFGLIETWSDYTGEFKDLLDNYLTYDVVRKKKKNSIRNNGGLIVFIMKDLFANQFVSRLFNYFQGCIILYLRTSIFQGMSDMILYITYVSPEGSNIYINLDEKNGISSLENNVCTIRSQYPACSIFLAGDLNARTKNFIDFIPDDNLQFVFNTDVVYNDDNFHMPRNNRDAERYNLFGRTFVDLCCTHNLHVLNGRLFDDVDGNFTCFTSNGCSVVDYHIASTSLFPFISYFSVVERTESDHLPLHTRFSFKHRQWLNNVNSTDKQNSLRNLVKFKWNELHRSSFITLFRNNIASMSSKLTNHITFDINRAVELIVELYHNSAESMKIKTKRGEATNQPWWDTKCEKLKYAKFLALRRFRYTNNSADLAIYLYNQKSFKLTCKQKKLEFQNINKRKLVDSRKDP